jgi:hypothetical protein
MESLTKAELQLVYNLYGSARQFIANGEEAMPFMFLCKLPTEQQNGKLTPIQIKMPNTDEGKDELAAKLRQTVKKAKPDIVVFLGEVWAVQPTPQEIAYEKAEGVLPTMPCNHPKRIECLRLDIAKRTGGNWQVLEEITKDADGKRSIPETPTIVQMGKDELQRAGRFANLFE